MLRNTVTGRTLAIYNNGGTTLQRINLYGNGLLGYVQQPSNNRYYYVKDHLGSIRQVIHKTADYGNDNVVASKNYQPYGSIIAAYNNATDDRYNFTGKERDNETNFDYFGARYYDNDIGRWTTVDPLASKYPGVSPYSYVQNNPLNRFDPDGREDWPAVVKAGWRIVSSVGVYGLGLATIGAGAASIPETAGMGSFVMFGGMGLTTVAAYNLGAGVNDLNIALMTPDGMKAEVTKTLLGKFTTEFGGGKPLEKAMDIVEGMVLGNYKMGQNLIDGKAIEALIQSGEVSQQLMDFIKAKVEEDKNKQNEERKREEELKKKREEEEKK